MYLLYQNFSVCVICASEMRFALIAIVDILVGDSYVIILKVFWQLQGQVFCALPLCMCVGFILLLSVNLLKSHLASIINTGVACYVNVGCGGGRV